MLLCWGARVCRWRWAGVFCCGNHSFTLFWSPLLFLRNDTYFCHTVRYFLEKKVLCRLARNRISVTVRDLKHSLWAKQCWGSQQWSHLGNSCIYRYTNQSCCNFLEGQTSSTKTEESVLLMRGPGSLMVVSEWLAQRVLTAGTGSPISPSDSYHNGTDLTARDLSFHARKMGVIIITFWIWGEMKT